MPINKDDPKYQASREMVKEILTDLFGAEESDPLLEPVLRRYTARLKEKKPKGFDPFNPFGLDVKET